MDWKLALLCLLLGASPFIGFFLGGALRRYFERKKWWGFEE